MRKNSFPFLSVVFLSVLGLVSCGGVTTPNSEKPLVFFNRQPSDPDTGDIDMTTMDHSDKTYYVGFDAAGGGAVQGTMITDYLKTRTKAELDRNGDGILGYALCIGDVGHNDSKARTKGARQALGTWNADASDPYAPETSATIVGSVTVKDGTLSVKEVDVQAMTGTDGTTWNADAAATAMATWATNDTSSKNIDMVVSNNDGMAMGCLSNTNFPTESDGTNIPIFGYDANADAVAAIGTGKFTGTVSQNVDAQAAGVLEVARNLLEGVTGDDVVTKGFTSVDSHGNKISATMDYISKTKALLAENTAVTKDNYTDYQSGSRDSGIKQLDSSVASYKILLTIYNSADNFLSNSYIPALQYYAPLMNINLTIVEGDGQNENSCLDKMANLSNYDAYAINMVKTNSGSQYLDKIDS